MDLRLKEILTQVVTYRRKIIQGWLTSALLLSCFAIYPTLIEGLLWQSVLLRLSFGIMVISLALIWPFQWRYGIAFLSAGGVGYLLGQTTVWAWLLAILAATFLVVLTTGVQHWLIPSQFRWLKSARVVTWIGSSILFSFFLVAPSELETNFAEEEFFVALTALSLSFGWLLIGGAYLSLQTCQSRSILAKSSSWQGSLFFGGVASLGLIAFSLVIISRYQASFYSTQAPDYPGISERTPFLCGQVAPNEDTPRGQQTFTEILAQIEANPYKRAPEYGMLAVSTRQQKWAEQFREVILAEARSGEFLGPTGSVKFSQYEAALRAYYLDRVRAIFPRLFSEDEFYDVKTWFAKINQHTLAVGWVDFLYALAFTKWPEGPYENQENGAGLLAQLELTGYADPASSSDNRDYLQRNIRGWSTRFKNTDDAYLYQQEWATNAFFQAQFAEAHQPVNVPSRQFRNLSFEWSLLQAVPDGFPLTYNHPYRVNLAGYFYLGAILTGDPRYIWLAERALASSHKGNLALLFAQPGADEAVSITGQSPTQGSCLLFSHAGLPNQRGPLAPDKLVLRSGWNPESAYLLLNLRFAGWHRYKATNAITLFYKKNPIVVENVGVASYEWLPQGRSILRDKRIPRENLNGLLISRQGMDAVIHQLTGLGGSWTQDPPYYANIKSFSTLGKLDVSRTIIEDWHGWQHERNIFFFHEGPLIVTDHAAASSGQGESAISWHLVGKLISRNNVEGSFLLDNGQNLTKVVLPTEALTTLSANAEPSRIAWLPDQTIWHLVYRSKVEGQLNFTTLFLTDEWLEAESVIKPIYDPSGTRLVGSYIVLENEAQRLSLWQNQSPLPLNYEEVTVAGYAFSLLQSKTEHRTTLCAIDVTQVKIKKEQEPEKISLIQFGEQTSAKPVWRWQNSILTITFPSVGSACFSIED